MGWAIMLASVVLLWLCVCTGTARLLTQHVLQPPAALSADRVKELKARPKTSTAIVVLGGGLEPFAPEYGASNLFYLSQERLRYGIWLGRETGLPVAFSGGVGWGQPDGNAEARIAAQIAANEFGRPLKWIEDTSRDTRENAAHSVALLQPAGILHIVLVTHAFHMPRAVGAFEAAAAGWITFEAAPMGLAHGIDAPVLRWIPSSLGTTQVRYILRELAGRLAGA